MDDCEPTVGREESSRSGTEASESVNAGKRGGVSGRGVILFRVNRRGRGGKKREYDPSHR